jgi:hypothetical protein
LPPIKRLTCVKVFLRKIKIFIKLVDNNTVHQENIQFVFGVFDVFAKTSKMPKTQRHRVFAKGGTCLPKTVVVFER